MFDLRAYSDVLFRVDEVMSDKYGEWLKFDDRFFYSQNDFNRAFLAFMFDVEPKSSSLEETKELLKEPIKTYFNEGTFYSLNKALKAFYSQCEIKEWHEYGGEPYRFKLILEASKKGISEASLKKTTEIIEAYKNVRSVYDGSVIKLASNANIYAGVCLSAGATICVDPLTPRDIETSQSAYFACALKTENIINLGDIDARIL
jgi:putative phage tail protein|nr:MAG TPA: tail protein [Caudoviricetes sp.]